LAFDSFLESFTFCFGSSFTFCVFTSSFGISASFFLSAFFLDSSLGLEVGFAFSELFFFSSLTDLADSAFFLPLSFGSLALAGCFFDFY
jgi:hypothetical protein